MHMGGGVLERLGAVLEPSWAVSGRVLGRLGGNLGASWGPLLSSRRACPAAQALPCGHRLDGFQLEARAAAGRGPEAVGGRVGRGRNSEQPLIPAPPRARSASRPRTERGQSRSRPRSPAPRDRSLSRGRGPRSLAAVKAAPSRQQSVSRSRSCSRPRGPGLGPLPDDWIEKLKDPIWRT